MNDKQTNPAASAAWNQRDLEAGRAWVDGERHPVTNISNPEYLLLLEEAIREGFDSVEDYMRSDV